MLLMVLITRPDSGFLDLLFVVVVVVFQASQPEVELGTLLLTDCSGGRLILDHSTEGPLTCRNL